MRGKLLDLIEGLNSANVWLKAVRQDVLAGHRFRDPVQFCEEWVLRTMKDGFDHFLTQIGISLPSLNETLSLFLIPSISFKPADSCLQGSRLKLTDVGKDLGRLNRFAAGKRRENIFLERPVGSWSNVKEMSVPPIVIKTVGIIKVHIWVRITGLRTVSRHHYKGSGSSVAYPKCSIPTWQLVTTRHSREFSSRGVNCRILEFRGPGLEVIMDIIKKIINLLTLKTIKIIFPKRTLKILDGGPD